MAAVIDYYALLGVAADADETAIRAAYRVLAKQYHPDLADDENSQATERFLLITEAYEILRDAGRRAQYDLRRAQEDQRERARRAAMEQAQQDLREWARRQGRPAPSPASAAERVSQKRPAYAAGVRSGRKGSGRAIDVLLSVCAVIGILVVADLIVSEPRSVPLLADVEQVVREATSSRSERPDGSRGPQAVEKVPAERQASASSPPSIEIGRAEPERPRVASSASSRDQEALARLQALAEAERNRAKAQDGRAGPTSGPNGSKSAPNTASARPSENLDRTVVCTGEGRTFSVVREKGVISVSYNGGPPMHPRIDSLGGGMVVVSKVDPRDRVAIGFMRGDKDRTVVLVYDALGNLFRTFGVECSAAAF